MNDRVCGAKHLQYQPTDAEFRCPRCNAEAGDFHIGDPAADVDADCVKLHVGDYLVCAGGDCNYGISAKAFVAALTKKKNLEPCAHCKGTGLVKKKASKR